MCMDRNIHLSVALVVFSGIHNKDVENDTMKGRENDTRILATRVYQERGKKETKSNLILISGHHRLT